jgi:hypothetical protein
MSALTQLPQDRSRSKALFDLNMNQQVLEQKPDSRRHHVGPPCLLTIVGVTWGHPIQSKKKTYPVLLLIQPLTNNRSQNWIFLRIIASPSTNLMRVVPGLHCHPSNLGELWPISHSVHQVHQLIPCSRTLILCVVHQFNFFQRRPLAIPATYRSTLHVLQATAPAKGVLSMSWEKDLAFSAYRTTGLDV